LALARDACSGGTERAQLGLKWAREADGVSVPLAAVRPQTMWDASRGSSIV